VHLCYAVYDNSLSALIKSNMLCVYWTEVKGVVSLSK